MCAAARPDHPFLSPIQPASAEEWPVCSRKAWACRTTGEPWFGNEGRRADRMRRGAPGQTDTAVTPLTDKRFRRGTKPTTKRLPCTSASDSASPLERRAHQMAKYSRCQATLLGSEKLVARAWGTKMLEGSARATTKEGCTYFLFCFCVHACVADALRGSLLSVFFLSSPSLVVADVVAALVGRPAQPGQPGLARVQKGGRSCAPSH